MRKASLRHGYFILVALTVVLVLYGCDSAGPAVEKDPAEDDPGTGGPDVSVRLSVQTQRPGVQLSWEGSGLGKADRFRLYRSAEAVFDTTGHALASTTEMELTDTTATPSEEFSYKVAAVKGDSVLAVSEEKKALAPPQQVSQLEGEGEFYRSALHWKEVDGAKKGYHIYRSKDPFSSASEATQVTGSPVHGEEFTDSTVLDGAEYHYRVAAVGPEGHEGAFSSSEEVVPSFEGDPLAGKEVFRESCAVCHASPDATGLQTFSFPDTTIHRRDLAHISEEESFDVIEFLRSGDAPRREDVHLGDPEVPPFQPGGRVLASDKQFGIELFGQDRWPEDLTQEELLEKRPTEQPLPFPMPEWSNESHKFDWIADRKVPEAIRQDPAVTQALGQYRMDPTDENLVRLWEEIQKAKPKGRSFHTTYDPEDINSPDRFADILERARWIANLVATHALRSENEIQKMRDLVLLERRLESKPHHGGTVIKEFWTVGEIFQEARFAEIRANPSNLYAELPQPYRKPTYGAEGRRGDFNFAQIQWTYLAWMIGRKSSAIRFTYFTDHIGRDRNLGFKRVNAYVMAYVAAETTAKDSLALYKDSRNPYAPIRNFSEITPEHWQPELLRFLFETIVRYIEHGNQIYAPRSLYDRYVDRIEKAARHVLEENPYFEGQNQEQIKKMRDRIVEHIKQQKEKHG